MIGSFRNLVCRTNQRELLQKQLATGRWRRVFLKLTLGIRCCFCKKAARRFLDNGLFRSGLQSFIQKYLKFYSIRLLFIPYVHIDLCPQDDVQPCAMGSFWTLCCDMERQCTKRQASMLLRSQICIKRSFHCFNLSILSIKEMQDFQRKLMHETSNNPETKPNPSTQLCFGKFHSFVSADMQS